VEGSGCGILQSAIPEFCGENLKNHENLSEGGLSPKQNSNPGPSYMNEQCYSLDSHVLWIFLFHQDMVSYHKAEMNSSATDEHGNSNLLLLLNKCSR
jgi:hypothetical protein